HRAEGGVSAADVDERAAALGVGEAVEDCAARALLEAAGAERADGGEELDVGLLDLLFQLLPLGLERLAARLYPLLALADGGELVARLLADLQRGEARVGDPLE